MRIDEALPDKLIGLSLKKGATHAEVFVRKKKNLTVEAKSCEAEAVESSIDFGYCLRLIRDGRVGFSYSTTPEEIDKVVETAIETSMWTEKDEFHDFTAPSTPSSPEIYDEAIADIKEEEAVKKAIEVEKGALNEDSRIKKIRKAGATFSESFTFIANSKGNRQGYPSTACTAYIMAVAEDGADSQMGWEFQGGRFLRDVSFKDVGSAAARRGLRMLGARKMTACKSPVLLDNLVSVEFLGIFASLLSSEAVQKGKSLLKGKVGSKVISENIDIVDDGLMDGKLGSRPVDDEGYPSSRKILIRQGVLVDFMYNTYTAKKEGRPSTGNAVRGGIAAMPGIGPMNIYIDGEKKFNNLLKKMGRGLYILEAMGVHTANPVSGEFSIGVSGLWVEGGEIKYPVKEAVISGNILDFMGKVKALGEDIRFYGNIGSPELLIGDVDISA